LSILINKLYLLYKYVDRSIFGHACLRTAKSERQIRHFGKGKEFPLTISARDTDVVCGSARARGGLALALALKILAVIRPPPLCRLLFGVCGSRRRNPGLAPAEIEERLGKVRGHLAIAILDDALARGAPHRVSVERGHLGYAALERVEETTFFFPEKSSSCLSCQLNLLFCQDYCSVRKKLLLFVFPPAVITLPAAFVCLCVRVGWSSATILYFYTLR